MSFRFAITKMLLYSLRKTCPALPSLDAVVEGAGCRWDIKCYLGDCEMCHDVGIFIHTFVPNDLAEDAQIIYYQWNRENQKAQVLSTVGEALAELITQVVALKRHCYVAKVQLQQIKQLKSSLAANEAVLHEDYSENFVIKQQDEIMSAHWISEGVTLFTAIINNASGGTSYVVISDELTHDKYAVYAYNAAILADANKGDEINNLHMLLMGLLANLRTDIHSQCYWIQRHCIQICATWIGVFLGQRTEKGRWTALGEQSSALYGDAYCREERLSTAQRSLLELQENVAPTSEYSLFQRRTLKK